MRPQTLAAGALIPLAFIGTGLAAIAAGSGWLVGDPGMLLLPHVAPRVLAFAHLWIVGGLLTVCCGAVYQLFPVVANVGFRGAFWAWLHLALHAAGATALVTGFATGAFGLVVVGGALVSLGAIAFLVIVADTIARAPHRDGIVVAFGCAGAWLALTLAAGLVLALDLRFGWWPLDVLAVLRAHAHLGIAGFFLTLIQGAMFRLVPMFLLTVGPDLRRVRVALGLSQPGVLALGLGFIVHEPALCAAGAVLLLVSFALSARELARLVRSRRKRHVEPGLRGFFAGLGFLGVTTLFGAVLVFAASDAKAALAYGLVAVFGCVLACVEGMLAKIIPFLVWMRVYGPRVGREPTPLATALGQSACERAWLRLHGIAVVLLSVGAALGTGAVLTLGAWCFVAGQAVLFVSFGRAASHLWIRRVTAAAPVRPLIRSFP